MEKSCTPETKIMFMSLIPKKKKKDFLPQGKYPRNFMMEKNLEII